mgnify:CR=1 FL=1
MDHAVTTRRLSKSFGSHTALDGIDLDVPVGEVFGFLGPNGAGKSTTIRLLLDLIRPTGGSATVLGMDPRREGVHVRARIGYLPGDLTLPERLVGRQYLADQCAMRGLDLRDRCDELAERLDADLDRPMGHLSMGNRRKIGMIAAFAHDPELLVLDEPTGGLDPLVQQTFRAMAREAAAEGRTVFLSSHVLDEVQHVADRVAVLREGRLVAEERVVDLLSHVSRTFTLTFDAVVGPEVIAGVPGVSEVRRGMSERELVATVEGPSGPLVEALAGNGLVDLHSAEPDLEDVFLSYYSAPPGSGT